VQIYNDKAILRRRETQKSPDEAEIMQTAGAEVIGSLPRRCLSFLDRDGSLPQVSGLNWGQREGRFPESSLYQTARERL